MQCSWAIMNSKIRCELRFLKRLKNFCQL